MRASIRLLMMGLLTGWLVPDAAALAATVGESCQKAASDSLRSCVMQVGRAEQRCYQQTGSACASSDAKRVAALGRVASKLSAKCPDQAAVQAAGYGALLTPTALVARVQNACTSAVASLAARSYGGPHAAVRNAAALADQGCLDRAWREGPSLIKYALRQQSTCIRKVAAGRPCDTAGLAAKLAGYDAKRVAKITASCPNPLANLVAVDPAIFTARAATQTRCLLATVHTQTAPLTLDCGPRASVPVPARGVETQVVLPFATFGSRCGDGSDYAFRMRLSPTGSPVAKVVFFMQGGGVCLDGPSCAAKDPDLFEALTDGMPNTGMLSSTNPDNPFRDWTKVVLPYCTQDIHIGGGVPTAYPEITVHRYGAVNVRAAMQYVRDVVWADLDANDPQGYRADRPQMIFSGGSAGGYGASYNYHWGSMTSAGCTPRQCPTRGSPWTSARRSASSRSARSACPRPIRAGIRCPSCRPTTTPPRAPRSTTT